MDCIFCKIISREIPAQIVYEDDAHFAFLDITPKTKGHTLLIPKTHVTNFTDLSDQAAAEFGQALHHIAPQIATALGAPAYNLGLNNGTESGQVVSHVHWHIIPRYGTDNFENWPSDDKEHDKIEETFAKLNGKIN